MTMGLDRALTMKRMDDTLMKYPGRRSFHVSLSMGFWQEGRGRAPESERTTCLDREGKGAGTVPVQLGQRRHLVATAAKHNL